MVGVAVNVTDVPVHMVVAVAAIATTGTRLAVTAMVVPALVAVAGDGQVALLVITTVITLPLAGTYVYVEAVAPAITTPPFFHWYVGVVPPLVGVAVNVTDVPAQT